LHDAARNDSGAVRRSASRSTAAPSTVVDGADLALGSVPSGHERPGKEGFAMRMMMKVSIPVEAGNKGVAEGVLPKTIMAFVDQMKPEASFFGLDNGRRTAFFVFDMTENAMIPSAAEPFFMNLNASIEIQPVMNLADMKTGVEKAMKQR
jgi:hypothetical protein